MSSANFIIAENSEIVVKQEVLEEIENRGVKRSYVDTEPTGPATKIAKKEESELIEAIPVVKRGRGRPKGVKNRPINERPLKIRKRFNNAKTAFTYPHIISLALLNSPEEKATVAVLYAFIEHNFPGVPASNECWKNTLRHALMPKNGFYKEQSIGSAPNSRDTFWAIIPERREELINSILEKIEEHKETMEILRMRNIDDLPAMLKGEYLLPEEARVYPKPMKNPSEPRQRKSPGFVDTVATAVKQEIQEEVFCPEYAPADYWIPYPMPFGASPYYAHPYASAYNPTPFYGYPVAQNGYGMSIYGYPNEEISNGNSPTTSPTIFQQQTTVIKEENPPVVNFSNGFRSPQYPFRIVKQVSTSPVQMREPKVEEPSN